MTLHTKAATDDIYDIFNAPLKPSTEEEASASDDDYETEGDYTTDAESNGTTRHLDLSEQDEEDAKSVSEWSDFSRKHIPDIAAGEDGVEGRDDTQVSDLIDTSVPGHEADQPADNTAMEDSEAYDDEPETPEDQMLRTATSFIPVPPQDYDPPTRPYRDPAEVANNRLPFMTPITERTEISLEMEVERRDQFKTPCKRDGALVSLEEDDTSDLGPMSSPIREVVSPVEPPPKVTMPLAPKPVVALTKGTSKKIIPPKGPIVKDAQCNPVDEEVRREILANTQPPLASYSGFYDHRQESYGYGSEIRKFAKAMSKTSRGGSDKPSSLPAPVVIELPDVVSTYNLKRQLGAGAYAPVYLVENSAPDEAQNDENAVAAMGKGAFAVNHRQDVEALKMESPPTPWEFHMMRVAHTRLGPQHRASASLSYAHELHLYRDEAFLFLPYHPHGTLLDVVNHFRAEPSGVMDEQLAMFFTIELMRTMEALHSKSVLHGDVKPDNCLLRLDHLVGELQQERHNQQPLSSQYRADGSGGWDARGVVLIDLGRAIDMRAFVPDVQFIADWKTSSQDCAEMREGRPWTWQIDYHGLAGTIHCLLFGKYIETVRCDQGGLTRGGRRYRIRESLKRYWQTELWAECFDVLLNPGSFTEAEEGGRMPVLRSMRSVRERMERWLEDNCERGVGLKALVGRVEAFAKALYEIMTWGALVLLSDKACSFRLVGWAYVVVVVSVVSLLRMYIHLVLSRSYTPTRTNCFATIHGPTLLLQ
jgi:checkpoint serine/threonine-protein kinase